MSGETVRQQLLWVCCGAVCDALSVRLCCRSLVDLHTGGWYKSAQVLCLTTSSCCARLLLVLMLQLPLLLLLLLPRLSLTPGPLLLQTLLDHLQEELQLYDYDELTQVTFNAYALQLQLLDTLLADITQRADMLEAAGQAAEQDMRVLREALQRLAARKARVSV